MRSLNPDLFDKKNARRVAYLIDSNPHGGMQVFFLLLIKYIEPDRYTPVVMVPDYPPDSGRAGQAHFLKHVQDLGVPLIKLPIPQRFPGFNRVALIPKTRQIFRDYIIDVVHIHDWQPLGYRIYTISARMSGVTALVRTEHLPPMDVTLKTRVAVKSQDWMIDNIITVSDANLEDQVKILHRNRSKLYRSYGGIELERFNPNHNTRESKRKIGLDPDVPVVGFVGRLTPQKGLTYLIKAAQRVIAEYGPVIFLLIGDGPLDQELRQQVDDLNLRSYFHFAGFQQEVNTYMEAMDIGVMPSLWEGFALALLEFMAMGIPTVTSSLPCFREAIVDGESGLIASIEEKNSLADHILELLCDTDMAYRIGQSAVERVSSHFTIQRLAKDMMDLYDRILESKSRRHSG
jgi:glycosyltransferase involved in cell wall biosynthesis